MAEAVPDTRQRMVAGAADMLRRRGLNATSIRELATHADAPLGSTYHYFPGGKQQLVAEAVQFSGEAIAATLARRLEAGPLEGLRAFLVLWRKILTSTGFRAGCPVLAVAVEEQSTDEAPALAAAAQAFDRWRSMLAGSLRQHGANKKQATQVATLIVAAVEGAVVMCRAQRSTRPLDDVAPQLEALVEGTIRA